MDYLRDYSLDAQSPERQFEALRSFERDDRISVVLEEKGSAGGPVTSVVKNGPSEDPDAVHVQFLDYDSEFRHDDMAHHTVSVTRTDDGEWKRAELSYSWTDTGRVRRNTVDSVERIWPGLRNLRSMTVLDRDEAIVVSMTEMGLANEEIAAQWGCDEATIDAILASVRRTYERAQRTVERLESSPVDLDGRRFPSWGWDVDPDAEEFDHDVDWEAGPRANRADRQPDRRERQSDSE